MLQRKDGSDQKFQFTVFHDIKKVLVSIVYSLQKKLGTYYVVNSVK